MKYKEQVHILNDVLIALSWLTAIFAAYGYLGQNDLLFAPTQWLLISGILALNAIYFQIASNK